MITEIVTQVLDWLTMMTNEHPIMTVCCLFPMLLLVALSGIGIIKAALKAIRGEPDITVNIGDDDL